VHDRSLQRQGYEGAFILMDELILVPTNGTAYERLGRAGCQRPADVVACLSHVAAPH
jgi:hypothetical protein